MDNPANSLSVRETLSPVGAGMCARRTYQSGASIFDAAIQRGERETAKNQEKANTYIFHGELSLVWWPVRSY